MTVPRGAAFRLAFTVNGEIEVMYKNIKVITTITEYS